MPTLFNEVCPNFTYYFSTKNKESFKENVSDKKNPDPILKNKNDKLDAICAGKRQYREKRLLWIALEERT